MKKYFVFLFGFYGSILCAQNKSEEKLELNWSESENWKVGDSQENDMASVRQYSLKDETADKWTEIGNMTAIMNTKNVPMDAAMKLVYDQTRKKAPDAKLTFIEKDEKAEYPWIIFKIESSKFSHDKHPESQVCYVVQGKETLFTNYRAIRNAKIPQDYQDKCIAFFKTAKVEEK